MIATEQQAICKREGCNNPVEQKGIGPYKREYCSNACKQAVYRASHRNVTIDAEAQQRIAALEQELARYRKIVDLSDRQQMIAQFMLTGEEIGYKALSSVDVRLGPHAWYAFSQTADTEHLARAIVAAKHVWKQQADLQTTTQVAQLEKIITDLKLERNALRQQLEECNRNQS